MGTKKDACCDTLLKCIEEQRSAAETELEIRLLEIAAQRSSLIMVFRRLVGKTTMKKGMREKSLIP